jgi:hypothetical protein
VRGEEEEGRGERVGARESGEIRTVRLVQVPSFGA